MAGPMTREEREEFLADLHIGVMSLNDPERGAPLTAPLWYVYEPGGELWTVILPTSRKAKLLKVGTPVSLCAQQEAQPAKYVSVSGPVTFIGPSDEEKHNRPIAQRYLGEAMAERYLANPPGPGLLVRMRPTRWLSGDFGKLG